MKNHLITAYEEFKKIPPGELISEPGKLLFVEIIPDDISMRMGILKNSEVYISRMALKHIVERRKSKAKLVIDVIPKAIRRPFKVVDNSRKRNDSFLFLYSNGLVVCVVVEKTKTTQHCQVVSAFPVYKKIYEKMVDISGRAELPPFELPS